MAGLRITWSFDMDERAVLTYKLNFPDADCREQSVDSFIADAEKLNFKVDILHISPPCQPFSPAHTTASPVRDEANEAAYLSVGRLLEVIKPRIVTIEETFGLESMHIEWFSALIHDFIRIGYSMHWKILNCSDYGVPQSRKRLVIFGAG
jgi:DNA (cytosine-5)-methyltransferase 1